MSLTRCKLCGRRFPGNVAWLHVWRVHLSPTAVRSGLLQAPAIEAAEREGGTPGPAAASTLDGGR